MASIPDRVREMIQVSGLSQRDFGTRIGLDDSKLSKSLNGVRRFSSIDLARIGELCGVSVDWLVTGEETALSVAARTTGGSARGALQVAKRYSDLRTDLAALGYAQPWRPVTSDLGTGTYQTQGNRLAALAVSRMIEVGISVREQNLPAAIEAAFGVDVPVVELGPDFDGLAASADDVKLIVLAASNIPARQRFTLAHELGHLLAADNQAIHLDEDVFAKAQKRDPSELRANAFASAFLMPESEISDMIGSGGVTEDSFATLACDLMVTPSALAYRLQGLRLIDAGQCEQLKRLTAAKAAQIAERGEEFSHRVTTARTARPPGLLARDAYAAYESGAATLRPYADLLGVDVDELRDALERDQGACERS
ncbi:helix-turn-helix domain-containing protein [Nocardia brasiliensis]|uniref:helix-turn-helix domain-containing protein n=1 Tax=Nocardia brasiliensis TaxID=37326 RepID=UPI0033CCF31D